MQNKSDIILTQEMSIGQIFQRVFKEFRNHGKKLLLPVAIFGAPAILLNLFMTPSGEVLSPFFWYIYPIAILSGLMGYVYLSRLIKSLLLGKTIDGSTLIPVSGAKVFPLLFLTIIMSIFLGFLAILLIIPAIIFGIYWIFAYQSVIFSDKGILEALGHSKSLVSKRWWKTLGALVIMILIIGGVAMALIFSLAPFLENLWYLNILINSILTIPLGMFVYLFMTILFLNYEANPYSIQK